MTSDTAEERRPDAPGREGGGAPALVVGLDGSPSSWDAFSWAAGVAARSNGRVVAVYVMPWPDPAAAFGAPYDYDGVERARREIADELTDEAAQRARDLGVSVSFVGARGDVSSASGRCRAHDARRAHRRRQVREVASSSRRFPEPPAHLPQRRTRRGGRALTDVERSGHQRCEGAPQGPPRRPR